MTRFPDPPWAYVPGRSPRHAEDAFDTLKDVSGSDWPQMQDSDAWRAGPQFLDTGYYWEAHEVFEPVWLALPGDSAERGVVQILIQLANAHLKREMQRPRAVLRLCDWLEQALNNTPMGVLEGMSLSAKGIREEVLLLRGWAKEGRFYAL